MFAVIHLKKLRILAAAALLFLLGTAIINIVGRADTGAEAFASEDPSPVTLVIDAGHGGLDGGASAADGTVESEINLAIALKMREIARLFGIEPVLTREAETLDYPQNVGTIREKKVWDQKTRVALINSTPNAVLISVHQNTYPDARPNGTEVLYGKAAGSDSLAALTQNNLITQLCPDNRRVAAPISDKIYLMKNVICPAILVECGFLSNEVEAKKLESDVYRTELALVLISSYLQYTG